MKHCRLCDGPLALLGVLGNTTHTRCVSCGAQFSKARAARRRKATK